MAMNAKNVDFKYKEIFRNFQVLVAIKTKRDEKMAFRK